MSEGFDPYYTWLGIPPDEQPPNHYRLLGLRLFEDHVDAIHNAADRQMAYLRTFQTGPHSALSQKLLNEVAAARVCLSSVEKKAAYDAMLWQMMQPQPVAPAPLPSPPPPQGADHALNELFESIRPAPSTSPALKPYSGGGSRQVQQNLWILAALAGVTMVVLVAVWLWQPAPVSSPPPQGAVGRNVAPQPSTVPLIVRWPESDRREGRFVLDGWVQQLTSLTDGVHATHIELDVEPGKHVVRLLRPGFEPWEETIVIEEGQQGEVTPRWQAAGFPSVDTPPPANRLVAENVEQGTPASVPDSSGMAGKETAGSAPEPAEQPPAPESEEMVVDEENEAPLLPTEPGPAVSAKAPRETKPRARLPVPDEASRAKALATLKQLYEKEYASTQATTRLGLAAQLIRQARKSQGEPAEPYVMLCEARSLAERQTDGVLALVAVDELGRRFEVPEAEMKREALAFAIRHARTAPMVDLIAGVGFREAEASLADGQYASWAALLGQLKGAAVKRGGAALTQRIDEGQKRLEALDGLYQSQKTATKTLETDPADQAANLELGRFYCLAKGDWDQGLPRLAKGPAKDPLPPLAAKLVAQRGDVAAQMALADGWWSLAEKERDGMRILLTTAASYWYQQAMPRLAGADLARVQQRLAAETGVPESRGKGPFLVPLHGLGGLPAMGPSKMKGSIVPGDGFAVLQGNCRMEFAQIPASAYIHHLELTFLAPAGSIQLYYGDPREGARLVLGWDESQKKFNCRLYKYCGGRSFWRGQRTYDPQTRLRFTFYVSDSRHSLHESDRRILGCGGHPADLCLRIVTHDKTAVNLHRCEFRRWTTADAARARWPMPPERIEADWRNAAVRLCERNAGLREKPILADPKPYLIGSTGTAMEWITPGKFQRPVGKERGKSTEITLTRGFWIGRYEITQGEWAALVPANPSRTTGSPYLPVDGVSYEDAVKYCMLLNQQESKARRIPSGYAYRLPTEAEWEYACRAGVQTEFGVEPNGFWHAGASRWRPHEVGEGKPNAWGLFDMHGNLGEWCLDAWQNEPKNPVWRLTDPFSPPQKPTGNFPVRGGGWWTNRPECASHVREECHSVQGGYRGFRVVLGPVLSGGK